MLDIGRPYGRFFRGLPIALLISGFVIWPAVSEAQAKWAVDAREYGADCKGGAPGHFALDKAAMAETHVVVPESCVFRLSTRMTYTVALKF